jgi:hypothetical protein
MQSFFAVATVVRCILLCAALVEDPSTVETEANHPHTDTPTQHFQRRTYNVASPNIDRAREYSPPISEGELLAAQLEAVGVHDADGMGAALEGLGLRTPADLELLDDWAVVELDKELRESGASLGDRAKLRLRGIKGAFSGRDLLGALAAADIGNPARMAGVLRSLGMSALHEICNMLDPTEKLEMTTALSCEEVLLYNRAKLRRMTKPNIDQGSEHFATFGNPAGPRKYMSQSRRLQSEAGSSGSGSDNSDAIAIVVTVILGIGSFVFQASLARKAEVNENNKVREHNEDRLRDEALKMEAAASLERTRAQMSTLIRPGMVTLREALFAQANLWRQLDFTSGHEATGRAFWITDVAARPKLGGIINMPSMLQLFSSKTEPYLKLSDAEIAELADETKRAAYCECHRLMVLPPLQIYSGIVRQNAHLIEPNNPTNEATLKLMFQMIEMEHDFGHDPHMMLIELMMWVAEWDIVFGKWEVRACRL